MKRKLFLIGSPGSSNNYLPGVSKDLKSYIRFFISPTGGAWLKDEIVAVENPVKSRLVSTIKNTSADFILIIFIGHGSLTDEGKTIIQINKSEFVYVTELVSKNISKQLLIIDTCRSLVGESYFGAIGDPFERTFPSQISLWQSRQLYNSHLKKCEDGIVVCYSTTPNYFAYSTSDGSYFTTSLLEATQSWVETPSIANILPFNVAFNRAKNYLIYNLTEEQIPQLKMSNPRINWFPFALRRNKQLFW